MWINGSILLDRDREEDMAPVGCTDFCGWDLCSWLFSFSVRYIDHRFPYSWVNKQNKYGFTRVVIKVRGQSDLRQTYCVLCRMAYVLLNDCQLKISIQRILWIWIKTKMQRLSLWMNQIFGAPFHISTTLYFNGAFKTYKSLHISEKIHQV